MTGSSNSPETDMLLIVDVQNDFCPGGAPRRARRRRDRAAGESDRLHDFAHVRADAGLAPARARLVRLVPSRRASPSDVSMAPYGEQVLWPDHCVQGSRGAAFHPDLDVATRRTHPSQGLSQGDRLLLGLLRERSHGRRPGWRGYLRERGFERIFIAGLAFDFCVLWSAEELVGSGSRLSCWKTPAEASISRLRRGRRLGAGGGRGGLRPERATGRARGPYRPDRPRSSARAPAAVRCGGAANGFRRGKHASKNVSLPVSRSLRQDERGRRPRAFLQYGDRGPFFSGHRGNPARQPATWLMKVNEPKRPGRETGPSGVRPLSRWLVEVIAYAAQADPVSLGRPGEDLARRHPARRRGARDARAEVEIACSSRRNGARRSSATTA